VKILVDVNVFIDVLTRRANWDGSLRVLNLVRRFPEIEGWVSALTVPLLYFFRLRVVEEKQARMDTQAAIKGFCIIPLTSEILDQALTLDLPDFEDNIQLVSAETMAADYVITRNKRDFRSARLSILTPEEWLALERVVKLETVLQENPGN
jgi:predicted nucleic acid-binding protein